MFNIVVNVRDLIPPKPSSAVDDSMPYRSDSDNEEEQENRTFIQMVEGSFSDKECRIIRDFQASLLAKNIGKRGYQEEGIEQDNTIFVFDNIDEHFRILKEGYCSFYLDPKQNYNAEFIVEQLKKIVAYNVKLKKKKQPTAHTPLINADVLAEVKSDDVVINIYDQKYINAFKELGNLGSGLKCYDLMLKFSWLLLAAGGSFPFVIFSGDFAKELFKNSDFMLYWSIVSSGIVNLEITFKSLDEFPDVAKLLVELTKKLKRKGQEDSTFQLNKKKTGLVALLIILVNIGSFYSNWAISKQSTHDFMHEIDNKSFVLKVILMILQMVGASALVFRATAATTLPKAFKEHDEMGEILKKNIIKQLNNLLDEDSKISKDDISLLKQGKEFTGERKWISGVRYTVLSVPIILTGFYAGAFGASAYEVVASTSLGSKIWGGFTTGASFASKYALLGLAANSMSKSLEAFLRDVCGEKILHTENDVSLKTSIALGTILFGGVVWNTWFSAAEISQEFLVDHFIKSNYWSKFLSSVIGVGGSLPINFMDSKEGFMRLIKWGMEKHPKSEFKEFILCLMKHYAMMPNSKLVSSLTKNGDIEQGYLLKLDKVLGERFGRVTNSKYIKLQQNICAIEELMPKDRELYHNITFPRKGRSHSEFDILSSDPAGSNIGLAPSGRIDDDGVDDRVNTGYFSDLNFS